MNQDDLIVNQEVVHLLRSLLRVSRLTEARLDSLLSEVDLSSTRLLTLHQLDQAEQPLSLSQLASCLGFVKSNATQLIDNLEKAELVRRVQSADDRRCILLEVTEAGHERHEEGLRALQGVVDLLNQVYTPEERSQLLTLLQRLNATLA